jgi:hypothetical protein
MALKLTIVGLAPGGLLKLVIVKSAALSIKYYQCTRHYVGTLFRILLEKNHFLLLLKTQFTKCIVSYCFKNQWHPLDFLPIEESPLQTFNGHVLLSVSFSSLQAGSRMLGALRR